jgi:YHS domain-containing protein
MDMRTRIRKSVILSVSALLFTAALAFGHDPKKKGGAAAGMMDGCGEHHAAAMKASDELSMHIAEAKRSTTLAQMRTHVDAADKALADMKTHMHQCMEMMGESHRGTMGAGMAAGERKAVGKVIDPVCGMEVDSGTAPSLSYKGKTYYFCSEEDKAKFEKDPEQYLKKS